MDWGRPSGAPSGATLLVGLLALAAGLLIGSNLGPLVEVDLVEVATLPSNCSACGG
jgi:hypothetical protein